MTYKRFVRKKRVSRLTFAEFNSYYSVHHRSAGTLNLTDGTLGNYHRAAKAVAEMKNRKSNIEVNDAFGSFGCLGQQVTYFPNTLKESVELFSKHFSDLDASLEGMGLKDEDKAWFKGQVSFWP